MQNLVYEWVDFSKFGQIWLKFKKILEKFCNFVQNLANWYINGLLFLEKLVFVWVYFQIPWRHIHTKTKLEYPPGPFTPQNLRGLHTNTNINLLYRSLNLSKASANDWAWIVVSKVVRVTWFDFAAHYATAQHSVYHVIDMPTSMCATCASTRNVWEDKLWQ